MHKYCSFHQKYLDSKHGEVSEYCSTGEKEEVKVVLGLKIQKEHHKTKSLAT